MKRQDQLRKLVAQTRPYWGRKRTPFIETRLHVS